MGRETQRQLSQPTDRCMVLQRAPLECGSIADVAKLIHGLRTRAQLLGEGLKAGEVLVVADEHDAWCQMIEGR